MIFSSGKLFRINKSLPTSVCNQGHQAMKGIELYSYDLQSNTGTSLIYICIIYHHTLYFVILIININIHYLTSPHSKPVITSECFLLIFSIPESAVEWAGFGGGDVKSSQAWQFRDQEDLVINDQYDNIKDVCCDVSYHHWQGRCTKGIFWSLCVVCCIMYKKGN